MVELYMPQAWHVYRFSGLSVGCDTLRGRECTTALIALRAICCDTLRGRYPSSTVGADPEGCRSMKNVEKGESRPRRVSQQKSDLLSLDSTSSQ